MSKYDTYFLMKNEDLIDYITEQLDFFSNKENLVSKEIGDGNLNYVYRIWDTTTGKSIIVKQAGEVTRISADMKLSTDRGRIEADILNVQAKLAPGLVPEVYLYDTVMSAIIMEDMVNHSMMRTALLEHKIFPHFAENISTFMANTLFLTTDLVMDNKEKKEFVKNYINPDLCEISEDLVYTEPFNDLNNRNNVFSPIKDFVTKELYEDKELALEVAKLKVAFKNNAQSLVHGDLHSGSIFINDEHLYVFDPEFAFYGPMGYDVGNIIANMGFALMNGDATIEDPAKKTEFTIWVRVTIEQILDLFIEKITVLFKKHANDPMEKTEEFFAWYLSEILADTAGVCGLETIRRTVGMANVKDLTSILDENKRARAEKIMITYGKDCIKNRCNFTKGSDYLAALDHAINTIG